MIKRLTTEEYIERAQLKHGNRYDYSRVDYKNAFTDIIIGCKIHGYFRKAPHHHLQGSNCNKCATANINKNRRYTQEQFIEITKLKNIPNISFEKSIYKSKRENIIVTCSIHGDYEVKAELVLKGHGCAKCKHYAGEIAIREILSSLNIGYIEQHTFKGLAYKRALRIDFYIPVYNACIEFDGEQHFKSVPFWKGEEGFKETQLKDVLKNKFCELNNIPLLRIRFDNVEIQRTIEDFLNNIKQ